MSPEQNQPSHQEHLDVNSMDRPSPLNFLWGLVIALLTFLMVIIIVLSIRMIYREAGTPDDPVDPSVPGDPADPQNPTDPSTPVDPDGPGSTVDPSTPGDDPTDPAQQVSYIMKKTAETQSIIRYTDETRTGVYSENAIFVDLSSNTIVADLDGDEHIFPASMTKVMTLLVAVEHLDEADYNEYVTMSADIITQMQSENASGFGFEAGEELTVRDLLYAIALESDCAASIQLAEYVAGSHDAFVALMNQKSKDLGLINTKFVNATGLHDDNHYTTCREMATIMAAAMANETVFGIMSQKYYQSSTNVHGRVTFRSTFYVDVLETGGGSFFSLPDGVKVVAAKTGATDEAGKCLAACIESTTGKRYVIITANAPSTNVYCSDYTSIYKDYVK